MKQLINVITTLYPLFEMLIYHPIAAQYETVWEPLNHLTVYPNPARYFINISIETPLSQTISLQLYNSVGELVGEKILKIGDSRLEWNVSHLPLGMYLLLDQSRVITKSIVITE